jgi:REP element-mobilizing transposase RayT
MARPLRIEYPGAVYHVTSRGNARGKIFENDHDRADFLELLAAVIKKYRWVCHGFCLMGNHYHLLIETPEANLGRGMRQLNGVYTQAFNRRHRRTGHLLQGRYKAILVEKESYLLELCRYIVLNPVAAKIVTAPESWRWSSFRSTAGLESVPGFLTTQWILGQFGDNLEGVRQRYVAFVQDGLQCPSPWKGLRGGVMLGEDHFVERFRGESSEFIESLEVPKLQRLAHRPSLEELFAEREDQEGLSLSAHAAHVEWNYLLKEIGGYLGCHYATVSKMIKKVAT